MLSGFGRRYHSWYSVSVYFTNTHWGNETIAQSYGNKADNTTKTKQNNQSTTWRGYGIHIYEHIVIGFSRWAWESKQYRVTNIAWWWPGDCHKMVSTRQDDDCHFLLLILLGKIHLEWFVRNIIWVVQCIYLVKSARMYSLFRLVNSTMLERSPRWQNCIPRRIQSLGHLWGGLRSRPLHSATMIMSRLHVWCRKTLPNSLDG